MVCTRVRWDVGQTRLSHGTCQHMQKLGLGMGLVGVIGGCPDYATAPTGVCEDQVCVRLGSLRLQHISVHMKFGAGCGTHQASAHIRM